MTHIITIHILRARDTAGVTRLSFVLMRLLSARIVVKNHKNGLFLADIGKKCYFCGVFIPQTCR